MLLRIACSAPTEASSKMPLCHTNAGSACYCIDCKRRIRIISGNTSVKIIAKLCRLDSLSRQALAQFHVLHSSSAAQYHKDYLLFDQNI